MSSIHTYSTQNSFIGQYFSIFAVSDTHLNRYIKLIEFVQANPYSDDVITEDHHILPRSIFPEFENLKENPWNCIKLSLRHHFIAHWILSNTFIKGKPRGCMKLGFWSMCFSSKTRISSRVFELARRKMRETLTGRIRIHNDTIEKNILAEELDAMVSDGWKIGKHPSHVIQNIWINNGIKNKRVFDEELESHLNVGWIRGVTEQTTRYRGYVWVNDGTIVKSVNKDVAAEMVASGWKRGKLHHTIARGLISINNGQKTIRVHPDDVLSYEMKGWVVGHTNKPTEGKLYVNDGSRCKVVTQEEHDELISQGWRHGMLPRNKPRKFYINKDGKAIKVLPDDIDDYIRAGWNHGMGPKKSK